MPYEEKEETLQYLLFQFHAGYDVDDFLHRIRESKFKSATDYIKYIVNDKDQLRKEKIYLFKQIAPMEADHNYGYLALLYRICTRITNGDYS